MVVGPCQPYVSAAQVAERIGSGAPDEATCTLLAIEASETVYVLLGRQYPGICTATVRPVRTTRTFVGMPNFIGRGALYGGYAIGNTFYPTSSPFCGCNDPVTLGPLVRSIDRITIDGVDLTEGDWWLDGDRLHRVGKEWPQGQKPWLPDTEEGTWSITYSFGPDTPLMVERASLDLIDYLWLIDITVDAECNYPAGTTTVSRQGVSININDRVQQAREAGPVIPTLNSALGTFNPLGTQRVPADIYEHHLPFHLIVEDPVGS